MQYKWQKIDKASLQGGGGGAKALKQMRQSMLGKQPQASPVLGAWATSNSDGCLCEFKLENRVAGR